jgi:hypothetical protein
VNRRKLRLSRRWRPLNLVLPVDVESEKIDEASRRKLVFGKLVLKSTRAELSNLDAAALAELKSYRKPPKSIHRIMKGALYLFGHSPGSCTK